MAKKLFFLSFAFALGSLSFLFKIESDRILSEPISSWTRDHISDCAIVLTGSSGRIREGFSLLSQKNIKKLIISGVNPNSELRQIFPHWPFYGPLSKNDVILEKRSRTTYGNAQQALALVEALNCRDVTLITSRLHMRRAYKLFRYVFPKDIIIYKRTVVGSKLKPDFFRLNLEVLKSLFYSAWAY